MIGCTERRRDTRGTECVHACDTSRAIVAIAALLERQTHDPARSNAHEGYIPIGAVSLTSSEIVEDGARNSASPPLSGAEARIAALAPDIVRVQLLAVHNKPERSWAVERAGSDPM